jgi:hypothetical protein
MSLIILNLAAGEPVPKKVNSEVDVPGAVDGIPESCEKIEDVPIINPEGASSLSTPFCVVVYPFPCMNLKAASVFVSLEIVIVFPKKYFYAQTKNSA